MSGLPVDLGRKSPAVNHGAPGESSGPALIGQQRLGLLLLLSRDQVDAVTHHDRRSVSASRDRRFPEGVLARIEGRRQFLRRISMTIAVRSPPARPVLLAHDPRRSLPRQGTAQDENGGKQGAGELHEAQICRES